MDTSSFYHSEWHKDRSKVKVSRRVGPPWSRSVYQNCPNGAAACGIEWSLIPCPSQFGFAASMGMNPGEPANLISF